MSSLQLAVERIDRRLRERAAGDRCALNGGEVGVVGLVARIGGRAMLFRGERMDEPHFKAIGREESLGNLVIPAGAFDGNNQIAQIVFFPGSLKLLYREIKFGAVVFRRSLAE